MTRTLSPARFTGLVSAGRTIALRHEAQIRTLVDDPIRLAVKHAASAFKSHATAFAAADPNQDRITGPQAAAAGAVTPRFAPVNATAIWDEARFQAEMAAALKDVRVTVAKDVMSGVERELGMSFDVTNPLLDGVLYQQGARRVANISATLQAELGARLEQARVEGMTVTAAARSLSAASSEISLARGSLIARTELGGVANGASLALARMTGAASYKQWLVAPGATHPRHELVDGLDGQTVPLDGMFDCDGYPADHPGDPNLPPEEACNCRCSIGYTDDANG